MLKSMYTMQAIYQLYTAGSKETKELDFTNLSQHITRDKLGEYKVGSAEEPELSGE